MRYVQLRAFHFVAICGGFSRAAEALHLTQPAISDQVRKLEVEYDVRLFNRHRKQVIVTPQGKKLLEITHRMFEVEQQALELLSESRTLRAGRLNVIADSTHHILDILANFRTKYPDIYISVKSGNTESVVDSLSSYSADIGVLGELPKNNTFEIIKLSSTPIVAFASTGSSIAKLKSISLKKLAELPLVMREQGSRTRAKLEEQMAASGLHPNIQIEAEGREAVREIVASGGGIGVVSEAEFGDDSRLVKIPITGAKLIMDEALICLRERQDSKVIRAFMPLARQAAQA